MIWDELKGHEILTLNLRRLTEEKGIALAVVADRAQITRRELFDVMSGEFDPDIPWLERLAEAIGVKLSDLFAEGSSENAPDS